MQPTSHSNSRSNANEAVGPKNELLSSPDQSSNLVQAGQVLKPAFDAGKNTVQWVMQDNEGTQRPSSIVTAPPPHATQGAGLETPVLSPTSDVTSPTESSYGSHHWHISPPSIQQPGWLGGDGREIRFVGQGFIPEEDPNYPNYPHYRKAYPNGNGFGGYGRYPGPPHRAYNQVGYERPFATQSNKVWPRSRKQWAELAGWPKVPCGNVEYTQVAEVMPYPNQAASSCFDCVS